jgi:hypothetical protein
VNGNETERQRGEDDSKMRASEGRKAEKRESSVLTVTDDDSERNERF